MTFGCIQDVLNQKHGRFVQKIAFSLLTNFAYLVKLYLARFRFGESQAIKLNFSIVKEKKNYGFQFKTSK